MANEKNTGLTVVGVLCTVAAVLFGRLIGWLFGLQFLLPIIVGAAAYGAFSRKLDGKAKLFAPALGVHAGYLTWIALDMIIRLIQGHFYIGIVGIVLHLVSVVAFIALIVQPGVPPALLLLLRHAYSLVLVFLSLPSIIKAHANMSREGLINQVIVGGVAIAMVVLLSKAIMAFQKEA